MVPTSARKFAFVAWMLVVAAGCGPDAPPAGGGVRPGAAGADQSEDSARLAAELAAAQRRLDALEGQLRAAREEQAADRAARALVPSPRPPASPPELGTAIQGVVQAVDNKADVCVISVGSKQGVLAGMECVVTRQGEAVATLVIDKVFPNYASGSRKPGVAMGDLKPGDVCTLAVSHALPR